MKTSTLVEKIKEYRDRLRMGISLIDNTCTGERYSTTHWDVRGWLFRRSPLQRVELGPLIFLDLAKQVVRMMEGLSDCLCSLERDEVPEDVAVAFLVNLTDSLEVAAILINRWCVGDRENPELFGSDGESIGVGILASVYPLYELYDDMRELIDKIREPVTI